MDFLIELLAELFGWFGLGRLEKGLKEGNKKRSFVLTILFMILLTAFFLYMIYNAIQLFKAS